MKNLHVAMWKAAGFLLALAITIHLLIDAPLAVLAVGLWLAMSWVVR